MTKKLSVIYRPLLSNPHTRYFINPSRGAHLMIIGKVLRGVLKIRYLLLGGALGGGISLQKVLNILRNYN